MTLKNKFMVVLMADLAFSTMVLPFAFTVSLVTFSIIMFVLMELFTRSENDSKRKTP